MRRSRLRFVALVIAAAVVAGAVSQSSYGITWCFDWVAYQINEKKDANRLNAGTLRALLRKLGYTRVLQIKATEGPFGVSDIKLDVYQFAPPNPKLTKLLKRGDVLIFGDDHAGIVSRPGHLQSVRFDHFLQVPGKTGTPYTPAEATKLPNYFVGRGRSWSLREIFALSRELAPAETDDWTPGYWRERLGRLVFGAPRQYPFLHSTAEVWRRSANDLTGAFPGGTATELTLTIGGATVKTDLKSNKQTLEPTIKAKLGTNLNGRVELNGTLPPGWVVAVTQTGSDVLLNSPTGGTFSVTYSFDAQTRPAAYICSTKVPPLCSPAAQANISIDWDP
jgi:hypothetical protein